MLKKILAAASIIGIFTLSGCFNFMQTTPVSAIGSYDFSQMHLVQLEQPYEGQPMAIVETTKGTIKAVLYPEYAPNTVQNFINRANDGYYNGKDIYDIYEKALFMTGAYDDAKTQGVTEDGEPIANEYSVDLWTFKGAFCAFNGRAGYGDSRFFVINNLELSEQDLQDLRDIKDSNGERAIPEELLGAFVEHGSVAHLAGRYTVFAQTIEGFDVIESICESETQGELSTPVEPIYIQNVTISEYASES